jgi:hypothetical protein
MNQHTCHNKFLLLHLKMNYPCYVLVCNKIHGVLHLLQHLLHGVLQQLRTYK